MATPCSLLAVILGIAFVGLHAEMALGDVDDRVKREKGEEPVMTCDTCLLLAGMLQRQMKINRTDAQIATYARTICNFFVSPADICKSLVDAYVRNFAPTEICAGLLNCPGGAAPQLETWQIPIPEGKPEKQDRKTPADGAPRLHVLHLTDIHIDWNYKEGSEADCQGAGPLAHLRLCCRDDGTPADKIKVPAGPFGTSAYCDLPYHTFESAIDYIAVNLAPLDYVMVTGDFGPHVIGGSRDQIAFTIRNVTRTIRLALPDTPIYVTLGNHETVPSDNFPSHSIDQYEKRGPLWLYRVLDDVMVPWADNNQTDTILYRGSYVAHATDKLKLISLNNNYCSATNFLGYTDVGDPDGTMQWLIDELLDSERKGEKVHIMGHIPPGDSYCRKGWSNMYFEVVKRFESTIAAQFFGHTHYDHIELYMDEGRAFQYNWISPSLTTYHGLQPAFRIFTLDGNHDESSYELLEAQTYILNTSSENAYPRWTLEYNYKEKYNLPDLSPDSLLRMAEQVTDNSTLLDQYIRLFYRGGDRAENCIQDNECRQKKLCDLQNAKGYDSPCDIP